MTQGYGFVALTCAKCREPLLRITESDTNDRAYCPNCLASGDYKEIAKDPAAGLDNSVIIDKELRDFIQEKWIARKFGRE
jgi:hypothetical protein